MWVNQTVTYVSELDRDWTERIKNKLFSLCNLLYLFVSVVKKSK